MAIKVRYEASDGQVFDEMVKAVRYDRVLTERKAQATELAFRQWQLQQSQDATVSV